VLDLAKIEARHLELDPQPFDLPAFLDGIVDLMRMAARRKQIDFVYTPPANLPHFVLGDEKRLRQVLLNLLGNAVKFTESGRVEFIVGIGSWESGIGDRVLEKGGVDGNRIVQGFAGLAEGHGYGGGSLSTDAELPEGGNVRADIPDQAISRVDSVQHRRGVGARLDEGVHSVSADRPRLPDGTRDSTIAGRETQLRPDATFPGNLNDNSGSGPDAQRADDKPEEEALGTRDQELGIRGSDTRGQPDATDLALIPNSQFLIPITFTVRDTGIGIPAEQLTRIFQPFEQTGGRAQQAKGTGLGLAISQQLVKLMGSRIEVESLVGEGSTFRFAIALPLVDDSPAKSETARHIRGYAGPRHTVLVVDDRLENRRVLMDLLSPLGFRVSLAENGREAVAMAAQEQPHLILMDLVMPEMMGFEAVPLIRALPGLGDVPIIAVSASVLEAERLQSREMGCDDFLQKPVEADKLLALMEKYLGLAWEYGPTETETDATAKIVTEPSGETGPFIPPPAAELEAIHELARLGSMRRVQAAAQRLRTLSPDYQPFAAELFRLANDFDDEGILQFIEQFWKE